MGNVQRVGNIDKQLASINSSGAMSTMTYPICHRNLIKHHRAAQGIASFFRLVLGRVPFKLNQPKKDADSFLPLVTGHPRF